MCFFRKKKRLKLEAKQNELDKQEKLKRQEELLKEENLKKKEQVSKEGSTPKPKPVVKKEEVIVDTEEKQQTKPSKYHVSQNKDDKSPYFKQWRVRKQGSQKTIKFFSTQAEAIEFAQDLADKANSSIVIHKLDGSIRKQDYTKK